MEQITKHEQERLLKLMRKHRKRLLSFPNVRAVDIGYEFTNGVPSGRLAIRVHVERKVPESALSRSQRIPEKVDGVPVDVIESNPELHQINRNANQNPVIGGVNVGSTRPGLIGTLGSVVFDSASLLPLALSNYHIMVVEPVNPADIVAQPKSTNATDRLGQLARFSKNLDCAVCWVSSRQVSTNIADLTQSVTGVTFPVVGMTVTKSGLATGITRGIIDGTSGSQFTIVPDPNFPAAGGEISMRGDSGSLWLQVGTFRAVGLHYAGETNPASQERAWAKSMYLVVEQLKIILLNKVAIAPAWVGTHCTVLGQTRPNARCNLRVVYPSGRTSSAKGLGSKSADAAGWVRWTWVIGSSTQRRGAGTGRPFGIPVRGFVTLDGVEHLVEQSLRGNPTT